MAGRGQYSRDRYDTDLMRPPNVEARVREAAGKIEQTKVNILRIETFLDGPKGSENPFFSDAEIAEMHRVLSASVTLVSDGYMRRAIQLLDRYKSRRLKVTSSTNTRN